MASSVCSARGLAVGLRQALGQGLLKGGIAAAPALFSAARTVPRLHRPLPVAGATIGGPDCNATHAPLMI